MSAGTNDAYRAAMARPLIRVVAQAQDRLGAGIKVCPASHIDASVLGTNGIYQSSSDRMQINRWSDSFPGCIFSMIPGLSGFMAVYFDRALLVRPGFIMSEGIRRAESIAMSYCQYDEDHTDSVESLRGVTFLLPVEDAVSIEQSIYAGQYIDGVPNSGALICDAKRPIPLGGQSYGRTVGGKNVLVKTKWGWDGYVGD